MAGFRNIMAHDYEDLDIEIIYSVLKNSMKDIEKFISQVKRKVIKGG